MVDRAELFSIADEILAEGRQPSQRAIRDRLARGGSFGDIGPLFVEWATLRGYRPRPRAEDLPPHLRDRLATVAAEIWHDGLRNGMVAVQNERDKLAAENAALKLALAEMTALAETSGGASVQDGRPPPSLERVEVQGEHAPRRRRDTIAFWDRVMQEVVDLMGDRLFEAKEIFRLLDDGTVQEVPKWTEKTWSPTFLADKMRGRAKEGKFFDEPKPGHFRSRAVTARVEFPGEGSAVPPTAIPETPSMQVGATPVPQGGGGGSQAAPRPSLKRLGALTSFAHEDDDIPDDLVFSMVGWASEEHDVPDDTNAEAPAKKAS